METTSPPIDEKRATLSVAEFAKCFGRHKSWAYRQIYSGKIEVIDSYGAIMIPVGEIEKITGSAHRYLGKK